VHREREEDYALRPPIVLNDGTGSAINAFDHMGNAGK
jgi:hypothetical protein